MGTNYYFVNAVNPEARFHIGKSSAGWCFALHVYPEDDINDLNDWIRFWDCQEGYIENEYGDPIPVLDMMRVITKRGDPDKPRPEKPFMYDSWEQFHSMNHSVEGPNNLARHKVECHGPGRKSFTNGCIKNGAGTWDCIVGEFS